MKQIVALNRREFLRGTLAGVAVGLGGCRSLPFGAQPELRLGVVSDVHVTTPESTALFEASLRYFRERGVDAVMVPGDLTDWGLKSSYHYLAEAWERVFPSHEPNRVIPLFCTGNHETDGWWYSDMMIEMHANGYSEDEALSKLGMKECWEDVFHEPYAPIRLRTVKGYDFISCEWGATKDLEAWMKANGDRFKGDKPFFFFQHSPLKGTTSDSGGWADEGMAFAALKNFPNAITFSGHAHHTFNDELSIWQGEFTAIATPALSYNGVPRGYENGSGPRNGSDTKTMPKIPARLDLRGGQGYVVNVFKDCVEIERRDLEEGGVEGAEPWVVPLPVRGSAKPYAPAARAKAAAAPQFPVGARVKTYTTNTEQRQGKVAIAMVMEFPAAIAPKGLRVKDYEVRVITKDESTPPLVKRFLSPAFHKLACYEPKIHKFWFNVDELPRNKEYVLEVYPRNWYGTCGRPLVSKPWKGTEPKPKI